MALIVLLNISCLLNKSIPLYVGMIDISIRWKRLLIFRSTCDIPWRNRCIQVLNWNIKSTAEYNDVSPHNFINPGRFVDISLKTGNSCEKQTSNAIKPYNINIYRSLDICICAARKLINIIYGDIMKNHTLIFAYHLIIKRVGWYFALKIFFLLKNTGIFLSIYSQSVYTISIHHGSCKLIY